jgi:hypothetical protein
MLFLGGVLSAGFPKYYMLHGIIIPYYYFLDFVSFGFLARQYPIMTIIKATIGSLTKLLMLSMPSNMTIPKEQSKPIIMIALSIGAFLFLRFDSQQQMFLRWNPSCPTPTMTETAKFL